jgi:Flp pilus assembly protein TadD
LSSVAEPLGTLEVALNHATQLLQKDPALAAEQALEILKAVPRHPHAELILGAARRRLTGNPAAALEVLEPLAREQPRSAAVHLELGGRAGRGGRGREAIEALRRALQLKPESPDGWRLLADQFDAPGMPPRR